VAGACRPRLTSFGWQMITEVLGRPILDFPLRVYYRVSLGSCYRYSCPLSWLVTGLAY
jgi:hypothetical protein